MTPDEVQTVIQLLGLGQARKVSNDGFVFLSCPFARYMDAHSDGVDRRPSFWVSTNGPVSWCKCYTCHYQGLFVDAVAELNTRRGGVYSAAVAAAEKFEKNRSQHTTPKVYTPTRYNNDYQRFIRPDALPTEFLRTKGIERISTAEAFHLGVDVDKGLLLIPIIDRTKTVVGVQARAISAQHTGSKYFSYYPNTQKSYHLFGEHLLDLTKTVLPSGMVTFTFNGRAIVVLEGPLDVMHAWEQGVRNVVAIMGAQVSAHQAKLLHELAGNKMIALMFDPDRAGQSGQMRSIQEVFLDHAPDADVRFFKAPQDPKKMSITDFQKTLNGEETWRKRTAQDLLAEMKRVARR